MQDESGEFCNRCYSSNIGCIDCAHERPTRKLVEFFRSETGADLGRQGDYYERDPEETAIVGLTALVDWSRKSPALRRHLTSLGIL